MKTVFEQLHKLINEKLEVKDISFNSLVKSMGYEESSMTKAITRLENTLDCEYLGLTGSDYDLKYSSKEFLVQLCDSLDIPEHEYAPVLEGALKQASEYAQSKPPVVRADIEFKEPISSSYMNTLAIRQYSHVNIAPEVRLLAVEAKRQRVIKSIKSHHALYSDEVPNSGVIKGYRIWWDGISESEYLKLEQLSL